VNTQEQPAAQAVALGASGLRTAASSRGRWTLDLTVEEALESARKIFGSEQAAVAFLKTSLPILNGQVPLELIKAGRGAEVIALLERLQRESPAPEGSYWERITQKWMGRFGRRG
jgi:Protein of unknown function (DUF2384)